MSSKLIVIISTGEKEKASAGLGYAHRAMAEGWLDDVKVILCADIRSSPNMGLKETISF